MGEELEQLRRLEERLGSLESLSDDPEALAQKILPLFDDLLLTRLRSADGRTLTILSDHIAAVLERASRHHLPDLSRALREVIAPAISREIEANQDKMVDALYPIMGGMVSRYVTQSIRELMERINEKLEEGLSLERYKRKLRSRITGVSEAELLVEESGEPTISSLMVIHKETGLLIAEAHRKERTIGDTQMVASMASAIRDFINDWIRNHQGEFSEVEILSYGNASLYIESAGSVYIVAFLDAEPENDQRRRINAFFAGLIAKYRRFFQDFDGDSRAHQIEEISTEMARFLHEEDDAGAMSVIKRTSTHTQVVWGVFLLAMLGYGLYLWLSGPYYHYTLEKRLEQMTGQQVEIDEEDGRYHLRGQVASLAEHRRLIRTARRLIRAPIIDETHVPVARIEQAIKAADRRIDDLATRLRQIEHARSRGNDAYQEIPRPKPVSSPLKKAETPSTVSERQP